MKLKSLITGVAVYLPLAMMSQAATMSTTLDWQFNTGGSPSSPNDSPITTNNSGGIALCEIASDTYLHYYFYAFPTTPPGGFGAERGLWDTINGTYTLTLSAGILSPGQTLTYNLDIYQLLGDTNFLPGTVLIAPISLEAPSSPTTRTIVDTCTNGTWVDDTYTWTVSPDAGPLTLTIGPAASSPSGELLVDEIKWNIIWNTVVPPLVITSVAKSSEGLAITWSGGLPPYQIYVTSNLLGTVDWQAVGQPVACTNAEVPLTDPASFVRVAGSSQ